MIHHTPTRVFQSASDTNESPEHDDSLYRIAQALTNQDYYSSFPSLEHLFARARKSEDFALLLLAVTKEPSALNMVAMYCLLQMIRKILAEAQELSLQNSTSEKNTRDVILGESYRESLAELINSIFNAQGKHLQSQQLFLTRLRSEIFLWKARIVPHLTTLLLPAEQEKFLANEFFERLIFAPYLHTTLFFEALEELLRVEINH